MMKLNSKAVEQSPAYKKAYAAAQAGGMNNTESHEFALDQATRNHESAPAQAGSKCLICGATHTRGALVAVNIIMDGRRRLNTSFGSKTPCGLASMIDNETHAPALLEALQEILKTCEAGVILRNETGKPQWSALPHMGTIARAALTLAQGGAK